MAGTNEILLYGGAVNANVPTQAAYAASATRTGGAVAGVADPQIANKAWRQASFIAAALSQWLVDHTTGNVLDNGDIANVETLLSGSVNSLITAALNLSAFATVAQLNTASANLANQITVEQGVRGSQDSSLQSQITAEVSARGNQDAVLQGEINGNGASIISLAVSLSNYAPLSSFGYSGAIGNGGYYRLPGQFMIQWGSVILPTGNNDYVAYPTNFPNGTLTVTATDFGNGVNVVSAGPAVGSLNAYGCRAWSRDVNNPSVYKPSTAFAFIALGA